MYLGDDLCSVGRYWRRSEDGDLQVRLSETFQVRRLPSITIFDSGGDSVERPVFELLGLLGVCHAHYCGVSSYVLPFGTGKLSRVVLVAVKLGGLSLWNVFSRICCQLYESGIEGLGKRRGVQAHSSFLLV